MRKTIGAAALALLCVSAAPARAFTTIGTPDCGQWLKGDKAYYRLWLVGYLSGMNGIHNRVLPNENPLGKLNSAQQIVVWMDNYCRNNPLNTVADGGLMLFLELVKK